MVFQDAILKVSIAMDKNCSVRPPELCMSTTLVANSLPWRESQLTITKLLKHIFREDNITNFGHNHNRMEERQARWDHIQCMNTIFYMHCLHRSTYIIEESTSSCTKGPSYEQRCRRHPLNDIKNPHQNYDGFGRCSGRKSPLYLPTTSTSTWTSE